MLTPDQILILAALGGLATLLGLVLTVALAVGLYVLLTRITTAVDTYLERRRAARETPEQPATPEPDDLAVCQAIATLPTTDHPTGH